MAFPTPEVTAFNASPTKSHYTQPQANVFEQKYLDNESLPDSGYHSLSSHGADFEKIEDREHSIGASSPQPAVTRPSYEILRGPTGSESRYMYFLDGQELERYIVIRYLEHLAGHHAEARRYTYQHREGYLVFGNLPSNEQIVELKRLSRGYERENRVSRQLLEGSPTGTAAEAELLKREQQSRREGSSEPNPGPSVHSTSKKQSVLPGFGKIGMPQSTMDMAPPRSSASLASPLVSVDRASKRGRSAQSLSLDAQRGLMRLFLEPSISLREIGTTVDTLGGPDRLWLREFYKEVTELELWGDLKLEDIRIPFWRAKERRRYGTVPNADLQHQLHLKTIALHALQTEHTTLSKQHDPRGTVSNVNVSQHSQPIETDILESARIPELSRQLDVKSIAIQTLQTKYMTLFRQFVSERSGSSSDDSFTEDILALASRYEVRDGGPEYLPLQRTGVDQPGEDDPSKILGIDTTDSITEAAKDLLEQNQSAGPNLHTGIDVDAASLATSIGQRETENNPEDLEAGVGGTAGAGQANRTISSKQSLIKPSQTTPEIVAEFGSNADVPSDYIKPLLVLIAVVAVLSLPSLLPVGPTAPRRSIGSQEADRSLPTIITCVVGLGTILGTAGIVRLRWQDRLMAMLRPRRRRIPRLKARQTYSRLRRAFLIRFLRLLRPKVKPHHQRLEWKCS